MKNYIEKIIPAKPEKIESVYINTSCDCCKKVIIDPGGYDVDDIDISSRSGTIYPECGSGVEFEINMCRDCFDNKFLEWMNSEFGFTPTEKDWDF